MKVTNKHGLSEVWVLAVKDTYDRSKAGWRSGTSLIKPPQMVELQVRYNHKMTEDVSDRIWSLFGEACHYVFSKVAAQIPGAISERRFIIERCGKTIGLKPDLLYPKVDGTYHLCDFKFPSVWAIIFKEYDEWYEQINLYTHALRDANLMMVMENGTTVQVDPIEITSATVEVGMRDWSQTDAIKDKDYPQNKTEVIPVELWSPQQAEAFLLKRVQEHITAEKQPDNKLPPCSDKDRWARPDTYAVKKKGAAKAYRVLETRSEAEDMQAKMGGEYAVEFRQGSQVRCERYCPAKEFCGQYTMLLHPEF